jgi:predicted aconitase with swiveling domain
MNYAISGLETLTINIATAGAKQLTGKISLPRPSQGATSASQVVTIIKQNGTTVFTSLAGADGFAIPLLTAAADVITVALASSQAEDEVLNAVNAVVSLS